MTHQLRSNLPELPLRLKKLPVEERGYPVPWFVQWIDGKPDFRIMDAEKWVKAINKKLCWMCGEPLGQYLAFVVGPMCAVNRISSEPPCHRECAEYAVKACPFLTMPKMVRREAGLPEGTGCPGGEMIRRNPGVALVWITKGYRVIQDDQGGFVLRIGKPVDVAWYCEGRAATRGEVLESIESGLPLLAKPFEEVMDPAQRRDGFAQLQQGLEAAMALLPAV